MTTKAQNRALSPEFAAFVDAIRVYDPAARVTYFTDGKVIMGKRKPRGVVVSDSWSGAAAKGNRGRG